jgi:hypothetical protein
MAVACKTTSTGVHFLSLYIGFFVHFTFLFVLLFAPFFRSFFIFIDQFSHGKVIAHQNSATNQATAYDLARSSSYHLRHIMLDTLQITN